MRNRNAGDGRHRQTGGLIRLIQHGSGALGNRCRNEVSTIDRVPLEGDKQVAGLHRPAVELHLAHRDRLGQDP